MEIFHFKPEGCFQKIRMPLSWRLKIPQAIMALLISLRWLFLPLQGLEVYAVGPNGNGQEILNTLYWADAEW